MVNWLKKILVVCMVIPCFLCAVEGKTFFLFTVPKSGTFISNKFLKILSGANHQMVDAVSRDLYQHYQRKFKSGTFNFTHYKDQFGVKSYKALFPNVTPIVNVRDPRDVCVSSAYYFTNELNAALGSDASFDERLTHCILFRGCRGWFGPLFFFEKALALVDNLNPILIHFEDLVGEKGGGHADNQREMIKYVASVLSIPMTDERAVQIGNQLFGHSPTFREGQIGSWRTHFTEAHKEQFKNSELQSILVRLGYENDDQW